MHAHSHNPMCVWGWGEVLAMGYKGPLKSHLSKWIKQILFKALRIFLLFLKTKIHYLPPSPKILFQWNKRELMTICILFLLVGNRILIWTIFSSSQLLKTQVQCNKDLQDTAGAGEFQTPPQWVGSPQTDLMQPIRTEHWHVPALVSSLECRHAKRTLYWPSGGERERFNHILLCWTWSNKDEN